jgi:hypothetical protein
VAGAGRAPDGSARGAAGRPLGDASRRALVAAAWAGVVGAAGAGACARPQGPGAEGAATPVEVVIPEASAGQRTRSAGPRPSGAVYEIEEAARAVSDPSPHACKGQNPCKGAGGCKTDAHNCRGQNDCKGLGGCKG